MNPVLKAALSYAEKGWPVIPIKPRDKRPATLHGKNDATLNPLTIESWFADSPSQNVAILSGEKPGYLTLDRDPRNGSEASYVELTQKFGPLPETLRVFTGGGGTHDYFRLPSGTGPLRDRPNVAGYRGIDLKADGYLVAPPSVHESGKVYEWANDMPMALAPDWLINLAKDKGSALAFPNKTTASTVEEGGRNQAMFVSASRLRGEGVAPDEIRAAIAAENVLRCQPPLDDAEVDAIVRSVLRYPVGSPHAATDLGSARLLVESFQGNVRYEPASSCWWRFDGRRWVRDVDGHVKRLAKRVAEDRLSAALLIADSDKRKSQKALALKFQGAARLNAMVEVAETEPGVPIQFDQFDRHLHLLNVLNGTVDLKTGELLPHSRDRLMTKLVDVEYDPTAECPVFQRFLSEIFCGDLEMIEYLRRVIGYGATGMTSEQCFWLFVGEGANGKSVLLNTIRRLLGDYALNAPTETFTAKTGGATNDVARLAGARMVTAQEANANQRFAESFMKQITGDEPVTARYLHKEFFTYRPEFKLVIATNHLPQIGSNDPAMWRRVRTVPFNRVFTVQEQDPALADRLAAEAPGILAWVVSGAVSWYASGLKTPEAVEQANADYHADMDGIGQFLEGEYERKPGALITAASLYSAYRFHANENGQQLFSPIAFGKSLTKRGYPAEKRGGTAHRVGLAPKRSF